MTDTTTAVPAGYRRDAAGNLIAEKNIPAWQLLADAHAVEAVERVRRAHATLAGLKADLYRDLTDFVQLVAADFGVQLEGSRGDVRLQSYDGTLKIERTVADRITVGPQIEAAKALVQAVLEDIDHPVARPLAERAFRVNAKTGQMSGPKLIEFANVEIDDPRWRQAVSAIRAALLADGTATYFRAYCRPDSTKPWVQIPLDFSRIEPAAEGAALGCEPGDPA